MRYVQKTNIDYLRNKYKLLIGWGAAQKEFITKYNPMMYQLDYLIDANERLNNTIKCGISISNPEILNSLKDEKDICFIIFPNTEIEIIEQINQYMTDYDFIVSRLVECESPIINDSYSASSEDRILYYSMKKLGIENPYYIDIGVCHSIIRNNTYLFYEKGYTDGILIEPNVSMCELAKIYRPKNKIINMGASANVESTMKYYIHPVSSYSGHNTFCYEIAKEKGFNNNYIEITVKNINSILDKNCERIPDIIDIDTEGMDYEIIKALDTDKYRAKLICAERSDKPEDFTSMMAGKGYLHYMETLENVIYIDKKYIPIIR